MDRPEKAVALSARLNPTPHLGEIEATNPCVTRDTFVLTAQGPRQVYELLGKQVTLIVDGNSFVTGGKGFFKTGKRPIFKLETEEGFFIRLTGNHPVLRVASSARSAMSTEWVETGNLKAGDKLLLHNHRLLRKWPGEYGEAEGYLMGLLLGEGTPRQDESMVSIRVPASEDHLLMGTPEKRVKNRPHGLESEPLVVPVSPAESRLSLGYTKEMAVRLAVLPRDRMIAADLEKCSSDFYKGFLRGVFDCDGSAQGTQKKGVSIRLPRRDIQFLQAIQRMLLRLGIVGRIIEERRPEEALPSEGRGRKSSSAKLRYELLITNNNVQYFDQLIGFSDSVKQERLKQLLVNYKRLLNRERFTVTVKTLTAQDAEDVYDVRVPGVNAFDANGFYVHNCGEQPLLPYESCCLGSINLSRMVKDGQIDWKRLRELTQLGVRFLDNVIDMNRYPLPEIEKITQGNRKIGLGIMGFAHMLIRLDMQYDSEEAENVGEQVMQFIEKESKIASKLLAEERGPFPNYTGSIWHKKQLLQRNATTTTVAPTGTLSIIANTSSGIEPLFEVRYSRVLFGDIQVEVIDPLYAEMREQVEKDEQVRRLFRTAFQVSPVAHLRIQRTFQNYVDNAVSKTINLPSDATPDTIVDVYVEAHRMGLKGTTIFRDKSREFQVLSCGTHVC
jgi:ribonucleoside-diphosphate reductase alpha chain